MARFFTPGKRVTAYTSNMLYLQTF